MVSIRQVKSDHEALKELHRLTFPNDKTPKFSLGWWWIVFDDKKPVGFCGMQPSVKWGDTGYMIRAGVLKSHRGKGLQKRLIRVREQFGRKLGWIWLITSTFENPKSANNLIDCGFRMYEPANPWGVDGTLYWRKRVNPDPIEPNEVGA